MNLALFDFDGTISTRDSTLLFTRSLAPSRYLFGCLLLSPRIIAHLAGRYSNHALKEDFLRFFYLRRSRSDLEAMAEQFCIRIIPAIIRPPALARIRWHQEQGDMIAVVSASPRLILAPWCRRLGVDLIATELEFDSQSLATGRIRGKNCWGEEKVRRIRSRYNPMVCNRIFAYGDSRGDLPMLDLADKDTRYFRPFR